MRVKMMVLSLDAAQQKSAAARKEQLRQKALAQAHKTQAMKMCALVQRQRAKEVQAQRRQQELEEVCSSGAVPTAHMHAAACAPHAMHASLMCVVRTYRSG
jgi:hypothetical protein